MTQRENKNLEIIVAKLEEKMDMHCEQQKADFKRIEDKLDVFIASAENRFASKWTERFVYGLILLIVSALVGGAISQLFK